MVTRPAARPDLRRTFRSMASPVELWVVDPGPDAEAALDRARERVEAAARHLTRFDDSSALMAANRHPDALHAAPAELVEAVAEAHRAHVETGGLFDPRVHDTLVAWGYDTTFASVVGPVAAADPAALPSLAPVGAAEPTTRPAAPLAARPWRPTTLPGMVHPGGARLDLGGIGKGLAVRWAAAELAGAGASVLVDAGGDEWLGGPGPDGDGWKVGVEDPHAAREEDDPVLVLALTDRAVATSSVRRRRWHDPATGAVVHHLVDPRTGRPGGAGLASVTVVHEDPAWAEVWSKTLFLRGPFEVAAQAEVRGLAAAWVDEDGAIGTSPAMDPYVLWRAAR